MPSKPWILVCPSSRGIGQHLTRHLLATTTAPILATTRDANSTPTLSHNERLHTVHVDVTDESTIRSAARRARDLFPPQTHHLHLAAAIPGILTPEKSPSQVDAAASSAMFHVNTIGPLLLAKHFMEFFPRRATTLAPAEGLPAHATWVFMSARVGSIADNRTGGWFSYRASKAGVNSLAKSLDLMLAARSGDKALAMAYHPGTVKTDFSREFWGTVKEGKLFTPEDAVDKMVGVVRRLGVDGRGKCFDWRGEVVPS